MSELRIRRAAKSGTWYSSSSNTLQQQLSIWIDQSIEAGCRQEQTQAIIAPHAGYAYSGSTAAFSYSALGKHSKSTIFLFGPSHHVTLPKQAALSQCTLLETPLGPVEVDTETCKDLFKSGLFTWMDQNTDEQEHSLELHLPYLRHIFSNGYVSQDASDCHCKIVPILVGCPSKNQETQLAKLLQPYFLDPQCLFVISSDFCHWGSRFGFTKAVAGMPIHESIAQMDKEGIRLIEAKDYDGFKKYLSDTDNTICGRFPILLLLRILDLLSPPTESKYEFSFRKYAQSSQVLNPRDSSVSYAAISLTLV